MTSAVSDWEIGRREGELPEGWAEATLEEIVVHKLGGEWGKDPREVAERPGDGAGAGDPRHRVPRLGARQGRDGGGAGDQAQEPRHAGSSRRATWWSRSRAAAPPSRWAGRC